MVRKRPAITDFVIVLQIFLHSIIILILWDLRSVSRPISVRFSTKNTTTTHFNSNEQFLLRKIENINEL